MPDYDERITAGIAALKELHSAILAFAVTWRKHLKSRHLKVRSAAARVLDAIDGCMETRLPPITGMFSAAYKPSMNGPSEWRAMSRKEKRYSRSVEAAGKANGVVYLAYELAEGFFDEDYDEERGNSWADLVTRLLAEAERAKTDLVYAEDRYWNRDW